MNSQITISPGSDDDTIEIQLTPEQSLNLSQAAQVAAPSVEPAHLPAVAAPEPIPAAPCSLQPLFTVNAATGPSRWRLAPVAKMSGYIIAYAAFAWWSVSQLSGQPQAPVTAAAKPAAVMPRPVLAASSAPPAVKFINPFDATEVFEFAPGTSDAQSREQVAQFLLQRARERQSQWGRFKPPVGVRTASLYDPP